jgi:hypothetical protein
MQEFIVIRKGSTLIPSSPADEELLTQLREGSQYSIKLKKDRSGRHHRFFWGILKTVVENHEEYSKPDQLLLWLKIRLGYVEQVQFHDEKIWWVARSTSFAAMDQIEFKQFFDASLDLIVSEVIKGMGKKELIEEVEKMLNLNFEDVWRKP